MSKTGVISNSIFCKGYQHRICQTLTGIKGNLKVCPIYRCERCLGYCRLIDGRPGKSAALNYVNLAIIESFRYLGDKICIGGGCKLATIVRTREAWCCWASCWGKIQFLSKNKKAMLIQMHDTKADEKVSPSCSHLVSHLYTIKTEIKPSRMILTCRKGVKYG